MTAPEYRSAHPVDLAVASFFEELSQDLQRVEATDAGGASLPFAEGMRRAAELLAGPIAAGRKLMFIGNGASAAIASHQSVDYWKTGGIRAVAFNDAALLTCIGNDFGYPSVFAKPIEMFADPGDTLVAISSSGRSDNILRGTRAAREHGCRVPTLSGFASDNPCGSWATSTSTCPRSPTGTSRSRTWRCSTRCSTRS